MNAHEYVEQILQLVEADENIKKRLRSDLHEHIEASGGEAAIYQMGSPGDMAAKLMETLYSDKDAMIQELLRTNAALRRYRDYEYISKRKLFGLPLVHVYYGQSNPTKAAKGIIAIGNIAVGVIAIGTISIGLISFGALALGLLAFGGFAAGGLAFGGGALGLVVYGGVAVGLFAYGGIAVGLFAFGGTAFASHVAAGGLARGTVAIGENAEGLYTITENVAAVTWQEARALIEQAHPNLPGFVMRLLGMFFR